MCTQMTSHKIIKVKENHSSFKLHNKPKLTIQKIKVDGCLVEDETQKRCDYLFVIPSYAQKNKRAIYVELKGNGITDAIHQLEATLQFTRSQYQSADKVCFIVATQAPRYTSHMHRYRQRFKNQYGADLENVKVKEWTELV